MSEGGAERRRTASQRYWELALRATRERASKPRARRQAEAIRLVKYRKISAGVVTPPTDLDRLAKNLGVVDIRKAPLPMRGRCLMEGAGVAIELSEELEAFEERFTLAHELAHLIVEEGRVAECAAVGSRLKVAQAAAHQEVEETCDRCAEEILLPAEWLMDKIEIEQPTLQQAVELGEECNCTVEFVVQRAMDLGLWHARLIWFEQHDEMFRAVDTYPHQDELFLVEIPPFPVEGSLVEKSMSGGCIPGELVLRQGEAPYRAQFLRVGENRILAIIIFRRR